MALTSGNIVVGAARVYLGPSGTSKPAMVAGTRYRTTLSTADGSTSTGVGTLVTNWREVGFTTDGLEVATDPTFADVEVDQSLDAPRVFKTGMSANVSTTMAEATLDNLLWAWGQASTTLSSVGAFEREMTIEAGQLGDAPLERGLIAIGTGPISQTAGVYGERVYHLYRAISVEASTHSLSRTDPTGIPVTFRALPDDTTQRYGTVRDRTGVLT